MNQPLHCSLALCEERGGEGKENMGREEKRREEGYPK
jgi:hypothetical protein